MSFSVQNHIFRNILLSIQSSSYRQVRNQFQIVFLRSHVLSISFLRSVIVPIHCRFHILIAINSPFIWFLISRHSTLFLYPNSISINSGCLIIRILFVVPELIKHWIIVYIISFFRSILCLHLC